MHLKPGVKSTELWVIIGAGLIGTTLAVLDKCEGEYVTAGVTLLGALYTILRTSLKKSEPPPPS